MRTVRKYTHMGRLNSMNVLHLPIMGLMLPHETPHFLEMYRQLTSSAIFCIGMPFLHSVVNF